MIHPRVRCLEVPGWVLAAMLLVLPPAVHALGPAQQLGQYAHTSWTSRDEYSLGAVFAMTQTEDGYLWLASERGVARFDGENFTLWQPPAGQRLPSSPHTIMASRDGTLWIGTYAGLVSWDGARLTLYPEIGQVAVTSLLEDRDGIVWVGAITAEERGALCEIRQGRAKCHGDDRGFGKMVWSLAEDSSGALWVGAESGLWRWKPGPPQRFNLPGQVGDLVTSGRELLIGIRGGGLLQFSEDKLAPYPIRRADDPAKSIPDSIIKSNKILRDREGGIWIGTDGIGLHHVADGKAESFSVASGLSGDIACSLFEDREGNIWFSSEKGLDRFRKLAVSTLRIRKGPASEITKSVLATDDGSTWVAAAEGFSRWRDGRFRYYLQEPGLTTPAGQALFQDSRGRIWLSTQNKLTYFEGERFFPVEGQPGFDCNSITGDSAGNLWCSGAYDLVRFAGDKRAEDIPWTALGADDRGVALADRGGVWVGFWSGGLRFLKDGKVRETYAAAHGLGEGFVAHLRIDRDGALWAATEGGLSRVKDGRVQTLAKRSGMPCNAIHWSMEDDSRTLWMYTSCGVVRVSRADLDSWIADPNHIVDTRRWGAADGVPIRTSARGYSPPVTKTADGKLWFVVGEGIQVIDPDRMPFNSIAPSVYIQRIVADHDPYPVANGLRLPALVRDVTIEFTALSLTEAQGVQFRYRLEGQDTEWQDAGNRRQAFYTNLGPGAFRFRVKASNNNGVWNEEGTELLFSIAPAYYQTTWFRIASAVLLGTLIWIGFVLHARRVRREETRLRNVIEGLPTLAFSVYPDGSLDLVNQRWLDYFGVGAGAQSLRDFRSALHPADAEAHLRKWQAALAGGEPFENESRHRNAAGEYRWFLVRAVPLRDADGKIVRWNGTLTDIEERKRAEDERERLRRLEAQIAHTNRLSMLGELTASIAHEINQPIGASLASAGAGLRWLDREQPALQQARDAFTRIKDDSKRAADIITGLRAFYKKDVSPERVSIDVNEVVREMFVLLRGEADRCSVTMRTGLAPNLPAACANRVQLQQVLMNLIVNGIEAMKENGGELVIRTEVAGSGLKVSVSDTGAGIPAEQMEQIFNTFVSTKPSGTGLGLAISRTIIASHGGRLWVEARAGAGATFCFTLPTDCSR
jgi:PAS domain S-box-containing protein